MIHVQTLHLTRILGVPIHEQEIMYYELQANFDLELISLFQKSKLPIVQCASHWALARAKRVVTLTYAKDDS